MRLDALIRELGGSSIFKEINIFDLKSLTDLLDKLEKEHSHDSFYPKLLSVSYRDLYHNNSSSNKNILQKNLGNRVNGQFSPEEVKMHVENRFNVTYASTIRGYCTIYLNGDYFETDPAFSYNITLGLFEHTNFKPAEIDSNGKIFIPFEDTIKRATRITKIGFDDDKLHYI